MTAGSKDVIQVERASFRLEIEEEQDRNIKQRSTERLVNVGGRHENAIFFGS